MQQTHARLASGLLGETRNVPELIDRLRRWWKSRRPPEQPAPGGPDDAPGPTPAASRSPAPPCLSEGTFEWAGVRRRYGLCAPAAVAPGPQPLLVMLHGCQQTAADFTRATRMNAHAERLGVVVAWPEQSTRANRSRCWNWFEAVDQRRGHGEVAWLARFTEDLVNRLHLDDRRVYVAGLSAGGAMALVAAGAYPDLYAAVGVHSGVPAGVAMNLSGGLAAMRYGAGAMGSLQSLAAPWPGVPTIVFHGDADRVVHPDNAHEIYRRTLAGVSADAIQEVVIELAASATCHACEHTVARLAGTQAPLAELWVIRGGEHAWFGGESGAPFTDPAGPDASALLLDFLLAHARAG